MRWLKFERNGQKIKNYKLNEEVFFKCYLRRRWKNATSIY